MDSNLSRVTPRPIVVPTRDQQGRNPRRDPQTPFRVPTDDTPPGDADDASPESHTDADLPVGHAENDEAGRRLDVTA